MVYLLLTLILMALIYSPQWWVRHVMKKYSSDRADLPGTGAELAQHLIQRFQLEGVAVEETREGGDHFDPTVPAVRLSPSVHQGRSLKAVAIATHEVGHALQFHRQERIFQLRQRYVPLAMAMRKAGELLLLASPVIGWIGKAPALLLMVAAVALLLQLLGALVYLIILPEEWDASFNKALPILTEGEYVAREDLPAIHTLLKAAALTYLAAALASVVHLGRWAWLLRR